MAGLSACTALVELYLSHNGIWALDSGLTRLTGLKVTGAGRGALCVQMLATNPIPCHSPSLCPVWGVLLLTGHGPQHMFDVQSLRSKQAVYS